MTAFDPALAMKTAKRIRNIEPIAAELLEAAVEAFAQESLERADIETHSLSRDLMQEYTARPKR